MADIAVSGALALVEIVSTFLSQEINLKQDVQNDIDCITAWLHTMKAFLLDKEGQETSQVDQDRVRRIREFAYDIEDIIDEFMFHIPQNFHRHRVTQIAHNWYHYFDQRDALITLSSRIQEIRRMMENVGIMNLYIGGAVNVGESSTSGTQPVSHMFHPSSGEDEIFGFQSLVKDISIQLLSDEPKRLTVSITGPAGSGKTALAKKVFEDEFVRGCFESVSWVRVSPLLNLEYLLRILLGQVENEVSVPIQGNIIATRERLRRQLQNKTYLIVLDDVWREQDWERILGELPNTTRRCRIIVTSCNHAVARSCVDERRYMHELEGLSWKDARNLFCKKVFRSTGGECPRDLEQLAERIVTKCEGLPLAIKTVGTLLSHRLPIPSAWRTFHDSIGADISIAGSLLPGYNDLRARPELKSCFLYFGIFPEDYSIQRERLIRLWIAEGFVKKERNKSIDETAEDHLNELVQRNLVSVSKRDIDGRVRSCRVLNLIREFIISKAEEENFIRVLTEGSHSSQDKIRRVSLISEIQTFSPQESLGQARSAFFFGKVNFSSCSRLFKLIRVLELKGAPVESFPEVILGLCLLRYLSLQNTKIRSIPKSIKRLCLLETLDLKQTLITNVPDEVFRLRHLCHLLVYRHEFSNYMTFDCVKGVLVGDEVGALAFIEKLTLIQVNSHVIRALGNLIHLRRLGIVGLKEKDGRRFCEALQKMLELSTLDVRSEREDAPLDLDYIPGGPAFEFLQRLYLKGRLGRIPRWVSSLQSLIKIPLKWSRLVNSSPLDALEDLPNLMELVMVDSYMGSFLWFKAGTFKKLKVLVIEQFEPLQLIVIQERAMPDLEKMKICKCENLKTLPEGINGLSRLQELTLQDMHDEFLHEVKHENNSLVQHIRVIEAYDTRRNTTWSQRNSS